MSATTQRKKTAKKKKKAREAAASTSGDAFAAAAEALGDAVCASFAQMNRFAVDVSEPTRAMIDACRWEEATTLATRAKAIVISASAAREENPDGHAQLVAHFCNNRKTLAPLLLTIDRPARAPCCPYVC